MTKIIPLAKTFLLAFFILAAASPVIPALASISTPLIYLALFLLAAHLVEYFVFHKRLTAKAPNENHFVKSLLFGVAHIKPVLNREAEKE